MTKMEIVSIEWGNLEDVITVRYTRKRLFRAPIVAEARYFGAYSVWRDAETGVRQPTHIEAILADIWALERWRRDAVEVDP